MTPSLKLMNPLLAQLRVLPTKLATTLYSSNALTECWNACPFSSFKLSHSLSLTYLHACHLAFLDWFPTWLTYLLASLLSYSPTNFNNPLLSGTLVCLQGNHYAKEWAIACRNLSHSKYARELESKSPRSQRGRREWITLHAYTQRIVGVWWGVQAASGWCMALH